MVEVAIERLDSIDLVILPSLRSEKEISNIRDSIAVRVLAGNLEKGLSAIHKKVETWQILMRILAIRLSHSSNKRYCMSYKYTAS